MGLVTLWAEGTSQDGRATDVMEATVADGATTYIYMIVKGRRCAMLEGAGRETESIGTVHLDGGGRTAYPSLIVELMVSVGAAYLGADLIGLDHVHASLEGSMAHERGAEPCGVAEGDALEGDITDGLVGCAFHLEQGLKGGSDDLGGGHVFVVQRHVIETLFAGVEMPLAGFVEQLE